MVVVVVECCCCIPYRLVLMLVLTFAPSVLTFAPCALTFALVVLSFHQPAQVLHLHTWWWSLAATCAGCIFLSAIVANNPCTGGGATRCNLRWWSFSFHPLMHILHLRLSNLHCVVVVCSGINIYITYSGIH